MRTGPTLIPQAALKFALAPRKRFRAGEDLDIFQTVCVNRPEFVFGRGELQDLNPDMLSLPLE